MPTDPCVGAIHIYKEYKMDNIKIIYNDSDLFSKELNIGLHEYNKENCEFIRKKNNREIMNLSVYDKEKPIGGASGWIEFGWYYLDQLYISDEYRKKGIGSKIIKELERISRNKDCMGIKTETWSFQAKEFYEKQGFTIYGELNDCPPGAVEYYLCLWIK